VELRLWLLLHAAWKPTQGGAKAGETFIAYSQAAEMIGHGRTALAVAFQRLRASGLIVLVRQGTRPRAPGAAVLGRQATVWDLPSRHSGERPKPPLPAGVERPWGKVRLNVNRLRADVRDLSPAATKVLAFAVAYRSRTRDGNLVMDASFALPTRFLARALGMSASSVAKATADLVKTGRLVLDEKPSGRRPATFRLHGRYTKHERHVGKRPAPPRAMVTTGGPHGGRKRSIPVRPPVPMADASP
jgi:biotin operon repressor